MLPQAAIEREDNSHTNKALNYLQVSQCYSYNISLAACYLVMIMGEVEYVEHSYSIVSSD